MSVSTSPQRLEATTQRTWRLPPEYARTRMPSRALSSRRVVFMTANEVARETGWAMHGWGDGDRATNDAFAPLETFGDRFDALLARVRGLGFEAIDLWGAHLSPDWATDEHVSPGAGGARPVRDRRRDVRDLGRPGEPPACVRARARGRHQRDRRRLLRRSRRARARAPRARRHARGREPSGADAGGSAREDRCRGRHHGRDGRHRLVGNPGLRRRQGDRGARRARRARAPQGRPPLASRTRPAPGAAASSTSRDASGRWRGSATAAPSPSSTSRRATTRARRSARCASSWRGGCDEDSARRRREHRRPLRRLDRRGAGARARRRDRPRRGADRGTRGAVRRPCLRGSGRGAGRRHRRHGRQPDRASGPLRGRLGRTRGR